MGKMRNISHIDAIFSHFCPISSQVHTSFPKMCTCGIITHSCIFVLSIFQRGVGYVLVLFFCWRSIGSSPLLKQPMGAFLSRRIIAII